jgi:integrase
VKGHIRERSPGRYAVVIDVKDPQTGKRRRRWHSVRGGKREAQRLAAELITKVRQGTYVERSKTSVGDFARTRIDQWEAGGHITARSAARYRLLAQCQIAPHLGEKPLQKLTRNDIETWHIALRNTVAPRTVQAAHRLLAKVLSDADKDGLVIKNVAKIERPPKVKASEVAIVRDVSGLLEKLQVERLRSLAVTALFTGMRLGELLALRERHLDLERGVIEVREALEETKAHGVRFKAPKTAAGQREITLPAIVIETLREHRRELMETRLRIGLGKLEPNDLLFAAVDGQPLKTSAVSQAWANLANRIGLPEVTFHSLRHTHASQLIAEGIDIVTISRRLGHANPTVTLRVYAHLFATDDSKAAAAINSALGSVR